MPTKQEQVISAVCTNKDFGEIIAEDNEVFGPFSNVVDFMRDYYYTHSHTPSAQLVKERFGDIELPDVTAPTKYYLNELRNEHLTEKLNKIILGASKAVESNSPEAVIAKMQSSLGKLEKFTGGVHDVELSDIDEAIKHYKNVSDAQASHSGLAGIKTGLEAWDTSLPNGIGNGDNVLLFGYSGKGKSWMAAYLAIKAWTQGRKVLYVSLEMTPENVRNRLYTLIGEGRFDLNDLARADVEEDELRSWAVKEFRDSPNFKIISIDGTKPVTPNFVRSKIDQYGSTFVVLDYAQLMSDNGLSNEMTPRLMNMSREIRQLALGTQVPIVWISSVRDDDTKKRDSAPTIGQIMGSRQLEYDATLAVAVHQFEDGLVELACRKNRDGKMFNVLLEADIPKGVWKEIFDTSM